MTCSQSSRNTDVTERSWPELSRYTSYGIKRECYDIDLTTDMMVSMYVCLPVCMCVCECV